MSRGKSNRPGKCGTGRIALSKQGGMGRGSLHSLCGPGETGGAGPSIRREGPLAPGIYLARKRNARENRGGKGTKQRKPTQSDYRRERHVRRVAFGNEKRGEEQQKRGKTCRKPGCEVSELYIGNAIQPVA